MAEEPGGLLLVPAHAAVLQLDEQLHEGHPEAGHDVGRVEDGEAADDADGQLPDHELLVVHGDEESADVLGLGEVEVDGGEVVEAVEDREADVRVTVGDAGDEELGQHLVDGGHDGGALPAGGPLQGAPQERGAGLDGLQPDLLLLRVQVGVGAVPHELEQAVALEVEAAEGFEAEHDALGVGGLEAAGGGGDEVLGGAGVSEGLLHQDEREDLEEAVRDLPLEAGN